MVQGQAVALAPRQAGRGGVYWWAVTSGHETREHRRGRLVVIAGCMFSGKTARLIGHLRAAQAQGRRAIAIKHTLDARYDPGRLATHDGRTYPAHAAADAAAVERLARDADVLGVDEAQFFGRALIPVVRRLIERGCDVVLAGIDHDVWGQDFPPLPDLKPIADEVIQLTMPCTRCGAPSPFTQRVTPVVNGNLVGGPRDFEPRCPRCFESLPGPPPTYE
jgi:thymidine kinase